MIINLMHKGEQVMSKQKEIYIKQSEDFLNLYNSLQDIHPYEEITLTINGKAVSISQMYLTQALMSWANKYEELSQSKYL